MRIWQAAAASLAVVAGAAQAEPGKLEVYGLLDLGITSLNHSRPFDPALGTVPVTNKFASGRVTSLVSGSLQTSRLGFRGQEDLGNGTSALFVLESHVNANNGTLGAGASTTGHPAGRYQTADSSCAGQLFCRQAWAGLKGDFGTLGFGRQYAFTYDIISAYDPFVASNSLDGAGATQQGGGNTREVRIDNSVKYTTRLGRTNLGAEYGFGGASGSRSGGDFWGFNLGYEAGPLGIQAAWQKKSDAQIWSATSPTLNTVYDTNTKTVLLAAKYRLGDVLLHGGYQHIGFGAGSGNLCLPSASYVCGAANRYEGKRTDLWFAGVTYAVTSRLNLVGAAYDLHQSAFQTGRTSQAEGHQRDFSFMADYRLSKRSDVYAGIRRADLSGGNAYGYANNSFTLLATGLRHVF